MSLKLRLASVFSHHFVYKDLGSLFCSRKNSSPSTTSSFNVQHWANYRKMAHHNADDQSIDEQSHSNLPDKSALPEPATSSPSITSPDQTPDNRSMAEQSPSNLPDTSPSPDGTIFVQNVTSALLSMSISGPEQPYATNSDPPTLMAPASTSNRDAAAALLSILPYPTTPLGRRQRMGRGVLLTSTRTKTHMPYLLSHYKPRMYPGISLKKGYCLGLTNFMHRSTCLSLSMARYSTPSRTRCSAPPCGRSSSSLQRHILDCNGPQNFPEVSRPTC